MPDRNMVNAEDQFIDNATIEDSIDIASNQGLTEEQTKEMQAGLNLLAVTFPEDNGLPLDLDGVFGPKTYARFKQFYTGLPKSTRMKLSKDENPVLNPDGKVV